MEKVKKVTEKTVKKVTKSKKSENENVTNLTPSQESKKIKNVNFVQSKQIEEFTKCFDDVKFLNMFFDLSGIHWRACKSEDFEQEAIDKMTTCNFTSEKAYYMPINVRGRNYSLFFLSEKEEDIIKFLNKTKRLIHFNF